MNKENSRLSEVDFLFIKTATIYPPIAYAYLAPNLEQLGLKVHIIDLVVDNINEDTLKVILSEKKPKYVGIKCLSFAANLSFNTARIVKETLPECHVIFGGHHTTAMPKETLSNSNVDFIIRGEGEYALTELIEALQTHQSLDTIKGIGYKYNSRLRINENRKPVQNLDELSMPAYHLFNIEKYFKFAAMHGMRIRHQRFMPVFTSRGCPYKCIYCHKSEGYKFRPKSPERVVEEIKLLINKYGIREFHIEDDTFNINIKRAKRILELIASLDQRIYLQFPNGLRADLIDEELLDKMRRSGTFLICLGIETGTERIAKLNQKQLDLQIVKKTVDLIVKKKILTWGYFILGFPTETREEMEHTIKFAKKLKLHFVSFSILIALPGTPLWKMIDAKYKISLENYFRDLNYSTSKIALSEVSAEEIPFIKHRAVKSFYSIWRMARIATHITSINDIRYYWRKLLYRKILKPDYIKK